MQKDVCQHISRMCFAFTSQLSENWVFWITSSSKEKLNSWNFTLFHTWYYCMHYSCILWLEILNTNVQILLQIKVCLRKILITKPWHLNNITSNVTRRIFSLDKSWKLRICNKKVLYMSAGSIFPVLYKVTTESIADKMYVQ